MNMMPLRGLPFGVRLTARLGSDVPAMLTLGPLGQPRQGPNAGEMWLFACRSMRRLHAKRQPWSRRLPTLAKCNRRPTRTHLLRMTSRARACARRNRALAAAGRTAHDMLGSPCLQSDLRLRTSSLSIEQLRNSAKRVTALPQRHASPCT
jgi:hypothetical protein